VKLKNPKLILLLASTLLSPIAYSYEISPYSWDNSTPITWGIMSASDSCLQGGALEPCQDMNDFMPAGFLGEVERAFDAWSSVANIQFAFTADISQAMIRMGGVDIDGPSNVLAYSYYPTNPAPSSFAGDVFFDWGESWTIGTAGIDIFWTALHEIGHTIGIEHSTIANTIMYAYYNPSVTGLTADDIAAAQAIYGPSPVPVPAAFWLFASGLLFFNRRKIA